MTTRAPSMCAFCTRWNRHKGPPPVCTAFPDGIPVSIWEGRFDHRRAYAGDKGIRFELREEFTMASVEATLD